MRSSHDTLSSSIRRIWSRIRTPSIAHGSGVKVLRDRRSIENQLVSKSTAQMTNQTPKKLQRRKTSVPETIFFPYARTVLSPFAADVSKDGMENSRSAHLRGITGSSRRKIKHLWNTCHFTPHPVRLALLQHRRLMAAIT